MKQWLILLATGLAAIAVQAEVDTGETYARVLERLGQPQGEIASGDYRLLYYERGKVELRGGKVTKSDLLSPEQFETQRLLREKQAAEAERSAQEARARRIVEGTAVRAARLADPVFMASSAADRVAFWQHFKRTYPEVLLGDEYTVALRELEQQYAEMRLAQQRDAQVDELERRVADAEDRARRAERRSTFYYGSYSPPVYAWMPDCNNGVPAHFSHAIRSSYSGYGSRIGTTTYPPYLRTGTTTYPPYLRAGVALPGLDATYRSDGHFNVSFGVSR